MQEKARVGEREAVLAPRAEIDVRAGARNPSGADHLHARPDETDHVVDRVARFHVTARRIDDYADVALAFGRIGQKLRRHPLGHLHVHFAENQHGAGFEQRLLPPASFAASGAGVVDGFSSSLKTRISNSE